MPNHATRVYGGITEMLSTEENPTPIVRLNRVVPHKRAKIYAKLEWYNPFGSVKDRVAENLLRDADEKGLLSEGQQLVEPTSGNTGMGLAMLANAKGYTLTTPLSNKIPAEKRVMLRMFGTNVEELDDDLWPAPGSPEGAIARAMELGARPEFYMPNQYENEANLEAHIRTTGPEIWRQTEGKITHFVAGLGTCGTITGNGRYLKSKNPDVKVIGVHPSEGHDIPGVRSIKQLGLTKLFLPNEYDALIEVSDEEAFDMCLRLNREESIIAGPSSAMALMGAIKLVEDDPDAVVVIIFPDNAFKYASTFERHFPEVRSAFPTESASGEPSKNDKLFTTLIENSRNTHNTCETEDLRSRLEGDAPPFVIDVRMEELYAGKHVTGAHNIPVEELADREKELPEDRDHPIVTVCTRGNLSLQGLLVLQSLGYRNVRSMNGGTVAWAEQGLPTND